MNKRRLNRVVFATVALFVNMGGTFAQKIFKDWPLGNDPAVIGNFVANHYIASNFANFGSPEPPQFITYPEVCTWYGALQVAKATGNKEMVEKLALRFEPLVAQSRSMMPKPDNVDHSVFGVIPLELYMQTNQNRYLDIGKPIADAQWTLPEATKPEQQALLGRGLSWQCRMQAEDIYMITLLQVEAFRATSNKEYINRAAAEMTVYLDALQQANGLFYHAADAPFLWSRANGWAAAGMTELLLSLPNDNPNKARIMEAYKKMMAAVKQYEDKNYQWHQILDDEKAWAENSGAAMFTYAMMGGAKKAWQNDKEYGLPARNAWMALVKGINENGDLKDVCEGFNKKNDLQYYMNRQLVTGDLHGQAPVLWCAAALLSN